MAIRGRACGVVLGFAGCFSDPGSGVTNPTTATSGETGATSGATSDATSGGAPAPTSSSGASTGGDGSSSTGGADTGTGEGSSDGGSTSEGCSSNAACQPGAVMPTGALCDPCGRVLLRCTEACAWGPEECVEDRSSCVYWMFDPDGQVFWQRVALPQPPPEHAPTGPVIAAFDLPADGRIVALTSDTFHVLSGAGTWDASGPIAGMLPGLPFPILQAFAVAEPGGGHTVYASGDQAAWLYAFDPGALTGAFLAEGSCCDSFTPTVQPPSPAAVRDVYIDLDAPFPWIPEGLPACDDPDYTLTSHVVWATPSALYFQDAGMCFTMQYSLELGQFPPFAAVAAPPGAYIGGLALLGERLYVFAGE